jgi:hypothetical protein
MTTMGPDSGSSSSSGPDDESLKPVDESDTVLTSNSGDASDDVDSDSKDSSPDLEPPAIVTMTARAYQLEMLEESLQQNIIVAVCFPWRPTSDIPLTYSFRWTLAVERLRCKSGGRLVSQSHANNSFRAILRIQAELEKNDKVSTGPQLA